MGRKNKESSRAKMRSAISILEHLDVQFLVRIRLAK